MGPHGEGVDGRPGQQIGPAVRRARSDAADAFLASLLPDVPGTALVAVGGYGRQELCPGSDLDVVLLHTTSLSPGEIAQIAEKIWYPVWDSGAKLDHSVRTVEEARELAQTDLAVAAGLLDARLVAGDADLVASVRAQVFADWRRDAARRLSDLREEYTARLARHGELAYRLEGDLKEARGGLRDSTMLRFISATWLVDVPHGAPERAREFLLDVRDALHSVSGRALDRLLLQEQDAVAAMLRDAGVLGDDDDRALTQPLEDNELFAADLGSAGHATAVVSADGEATGVPAESTGVGTTEGRSASGGRGNSVAELYTTDADLLMRRVAEAAGTISYAVQAAWRHVESALAARNPARRQVRRPLADGVVE